MKIRNKKVSQIYFKFGATPLGKSYVTVKDDVVTIKDGTTGQRTVTTLDNVIIIY